MGLLTGSFKSPCRNPQNRIRALGYFGMLLQLLRLERQLLHFGTLEIESVFSTLSFGTFGSLWHTLRLIHGWYTKCVDSRFVGTPNSCFGTLGSFLVIS